MSATLHLDLKEITIKRLDNSTPFEAFRCGIPEIDDWTQTKARALSDINRIRVFCAHRSAETTVSGFYALSFESKETKQLSEISFKRFPNIPVLYLTYIGVLRSIRRQGLGSYVLIDALKRAHGVSEHVGFHGVALRSLNDDTTRLYRKYGFTPIDGNTNPLMLLPVQTLADLFASTRSDP